ncbi:MAG: DUF6326 family protein [Actinomycetota bacterium]|nr:DUF6326 family protein [Actinomycetota bacterium]
MDALLFRTRAAALWLAVALAMTASLVFYLFIPGALEELLAGEMEGEPLTEAMGFFMAMFGIIPLVMTGVALLVSDRVNRYVNLVAGLAFGLFGVFAVVSHTLDGGFNVHVLMAAVAGVGAFLIAGLSLARLKTPTS